ncbi:MAG TPA: hypothetical protein GXX77_02735 [Candidatus Cloacimonetes bacterium]|nr:hypothetical protein [Candidatus Cloacimonadota bacterium]
MATPLLPRASPFFSAETSPLSRASTFLYWGGNVPVAACATGAYCFHFPPESCVLTGNALIAASAIKRTKQKVIFLTNTPKSESNANHARKKKIDRGVHPGRNFRHDSK